MKRFAISCLIVAGALQVGIYFPLDLVRHPPGSLPFTIPEDVKVISCHGLLRTPTPEPLSFNAKSHLGPLWSWRRGLSKYDGMNVGERDEALEKIGREQEASGYIIFEEDGAQKGIIYSRCGGPNTGDLGGNFFCYAKGDVGSWRATASHTDQCNSMDLAILRFKSVKISAVLGFFAALGWNIQVSLRKRRRASAPPAKTFLP